MQGSNHHKDNDRFCPCSKVLFSSLNSLWKNIASYLAFVGQVVYRQAKLWAQNTHQKAMQQKKQGVPIYPIKSPIYQGNEDLGSSKFYDAKA